MQKQMIASGLVLAAPKKTDVDFEENDNDNADEAVNDTVEEVTP